MENLDELSTSSSKLKKFQVSIRIIEGRQLSGVELNPFVEIHVGNQMKKTDTKKLTVSPFFDEYFVLLFDLPAAFFFDQLITLRVVNKGFFRNHTIGSFKIDVATVYNEDGHGFFHKWALLLDPRDPLSGPKGYIKCDMFVVQQGDTIKTPAVDKNEEEDLEANVLLPEGLSHERVPAQYTLRIFLAEGLPEISTGALGSNMASPYVRVSFAGHVAETSVKRSTNHPVWNQEIVFRELFPPLVHRMKIQIRDSSEVVIATRYLELDKISDDSVEGFMPTFGPAFLNMYGSLREDHNHNKTPVNFGIGEAVAFRGRLLLSLGVVSTDDMPKKKTKFKLRIPGTKKAKRKKVDFVKVNPVKNRDTISADNLSGEKEFLLFCCIHEASMIPRKFAGKPLHFELSMGNEGYVSEQFKSLTEVKEEAAGGTTTDRQMALLTSVKTEDTDEPQMTELLLGGTKEEKPGRELDYMNYVQSVTPPLKAELRDDHFCRIPYGAEKQGLSIRCFWRTDYRRIYTSNIMHNLCNTLKANLNLVDEDYQAGSLSKAEKKLRIVIQRTLQEFGQIMGLVQQNVNYRERQLLEDVLEGVKGDLGCTDLDRERASNLRIRFHSISRTMDQIQRDLDTDNLPEKLTEVHKVIRILRAMAYEPQEPFPDVFLWLCSVNKRIAYARFSAGDVLFSEESRQCGRFCGKMKDFFLKSPETSTEHIRNGGVLLEPQGELSAYLWFGEVSQMGTWGSGYLHNLILGYEDFRMDDIDDTGLAPFPPRVFNYYEFADFELRCHLFMAKSLIGADDSGLSDPYARIVFRGHLIESRVVNQTNCPCWDEMCVLSGIRVFGTPADTRNNPPRVVIEVYDEDEVGSDELIGYFEGVPNVYLQDSHYVQPLLKWHPCWRGVENAGYILAAFELLEIDSEGAMLVPRAPQLEELDEGEDELPYFAVPNHIRPVLRKYHLEVLFWGVRDLMSKSSFTGLTLNPKVELDIGGQMLESETIHMFPSKQNFEKNVLRMEIDLPENPAYRPPMTLLVVDNRRYGRSVLLGTATLFSIDPFVTNLHSLQNEMYVDMKEPDSVSYKSLKSETSLRSSRKSASTKGSTTTLVSKSKSRFSRFSRSKSGSTSTKIGKKPKSTETKKPETAENEINFDAKMDDVGEPVSAEEARAAAGKRKIAKPDSDTDWWTKYGASVYKLDQERKAVSVRPSRRKRMKDAQTKAKRRFGVVKVLLWNILYKLKAMIFREPMEQVSNDPVEDDSSEPKEHPFPGVETFVIYSEDLESRPEFGGFQDRLMSFEIRTGKASEGKDRAVGLVKANFNILAYPLPKKTPRNLKLFRNVPNSSPQEVIVRVYVIKAYNLNPSDPDGRCDAYLKVKLGSTEINDKKYKINGAINPVFGRSFEFTAKLPHDHRLTLQVWDWDRLSSNDLIGETTIDLENRFYSLHRATCGLPQAFELKGYNTWRDGARPKAILDKMCRAQMLPSPVYYPEYVAIGEHEFNPDNDEDDETHSKDELALLALNRLHEIEGAMPLVPEHIETRSLWHPDQPGMKMGMLEMWVDMFPADAAPSSDMIDITPKKPERYELRVIIYDTKEVLLNDYNAFQGTNMSDIYVKGFTNPDEIQKTDVHYRSLSGEGNFNWRMIFPVDYIASEECIVVKQKKKLKLSEVEDKLPPRLTIQLWDADSITTDDQLGSLEFNLNRIPRGAPMARMCHMKNMLPSFEGPFANLFKAHRMRAWWPVLGRDKNEDYILAGKIDMELELLTLDEAETKPAGLGREEPLPLPPPNRPDTSFSWFTNPLKMLKFIIWDGMKFKLLILLAVILLLVFFGKFIYGIPDYLAARMIGVGVVG